MSHSAKAAVLLQNALRKDPLHLTRSWVENCRAIRLCGAILGLAWGLWCLPSSSHTCVCTCHDSHTIPVALGAGFTVNVRGRQWAAQSRWGEGGSGKSPTASRESRTSNPCVPQASCGRVVDPVVRG